MRSVWGHFSRGVVPAILVLHFAIVVWLCASLNVWIDESYAMHTTSRDLDYAITQSIGFEEHPPFYFVVLWLWRAIDESVLWGRMLSAVSTLGFLIVTWRVVKVVLPKIHPAWVIAPMALNPTILYPATEMRPPAFALLISGLLGSLFIEGFVVRSPNRFAAIAYFVVSVFALYTYYYLGFLLLANGVALVIARRWRPAILYYSMMALVAFSFLPVILMIPEQTHSFDSRIPFGITFMGGVRLVVERIQVYLWPSLGLPLPGKSRWILPAILFGGAFTILAARRKQIDNRLLLTLAITAVAGLCLAAVAWKLGWRAVLERHALLLVLPAYLSLYGIISLCADGPRRRVLIAWTSMVGLTTIVAFNATFGHLAKSGDWNRVSAHIEANESPNEPILVFPAIAAVPFSYHYSGTNEIVPLPRPDEFLRYNYQEDTLQDESEIVAALDLVDHPVESIWVIVNCNPQDCGYLNVSYNLEVLERYVAAGYEIEERLDYFGVYVLHCRPGARLADKSDLGTDMVLSDAEQSP